jgi:predicted PurR-regulated permease PerM
MLSWAEAGVIADRSADASKAPAHPRQKNAISPSTRTGTDEEAPARYTIRFNVAPRAGLGQRMETRPTDGVRRLPERHRRMTVTGTVFADHVAGFHREATRLKENPTTPDVPHRGWRSSPALTILTVLGVVYTLYFARALLLPMVLAVLFATLLAPLVIWSGRHRIPRPVAAVAVVAALLGIIAAGVEALSGPAAGWVEKAPQIINDIQREIYPIRQRMREVSEAADEVEKMASVDGGSEEKPLVRLEPVSVREAVVQRAGRLLASMVIVVFLLYFLLAFGDRLLGNAVRVAPTFGAKRQVVVVANKLQRHVSRYLVTFTMINIGLGASTALLAWLLGIPNPALWGVVAGLLNYVPYLGPVVTLIVLTVVSMLSTQGLASALLLPGAFLILTGLEGQLVTPTILGRQFALNPIFIFSSLVFWGWLWGVIGALLAIPIMVSIKIVCDHVPPLRRIGTVLGG